MLSAVLDDAKLTTGRRGRSESEKRAVTERDVRETSTANERFSEH